jgi:hypothetical protein
MIDESRVGKGIGGACKEKALANRETVARWSFSGSRWHGSYDDSFVGRDGRRRPIEIVSMDLGGRGDACSVCSSHIDRETAAGPIIA